MSIELERLDATQFRALIREREREGFTTRTLDPASLRRLENVFGRKLGAQDAVREIVADVRARGDTALREWTLRIDGIELATAHVPAGALEPAWSRGEQAVRQALVGG